MDEQLRFGIRQSHWDAILAVLDREPLITDVILYGSRAKGNFKPGSDIDLCLKGQGLSLVHLHRIISELDALDLPWQFDLSLYALLSHPDLREHIDRVGISLKN